MLIADQTMTAWVASLQALARSGDLEQALLAVFGTTEMSENLQTLVDALARGDTASLPRVVLLAPDTMSGHPGAYSPDTDTIYLDRGVMESPSLAFEVLTHEWAHALASRYFVDTEKTDDAYALTKALLGRDHALFLSSHEAHARTAAVDGQDRLILPGAQDPVAVQWFDTALHIDWAREQLPMLNARAFDLFELGQNDSDAFFGLTRVGIFSPYGLQTSSATHFDNNNLRGSMETLRKRWTDGLEHFNKQHVENEIFSQFRDAARVGPDFNGQHAGLENLMYRFGQIAHASQDFYSHSNWIEMIQAGDGLWIKPGTLLDAGLDLPTQLNPGDYLQSATSVMVAMNGSDHQNILALAGTGLYTGGIKAVHWWVQNRQNNWGEVFAHPKAGIAAPAERIGGLMTGSVNHAIYYDTDFSLPMRAVERSGFFEAEYFRGFSHGGLAGAVLGQWVSPLSKDKPDNGRFDDKNANRVLFEEAKDYAALQLRHDFDRLGNLIFKNHGLDGLSAFAQFALVEGDRELYVSTYSSPGGRWDWSTINQDLEVAKSFFLAAGEEHMDDHDFHFDESNMRFIEVFHADRNKAIAADGPRTYLTQVFVEGQWQDASAGLINTHHDHLEDYGPDAFLPAPVQHIELGWRALWSAPQTQEGHYLGTVYFVANDNTDARVHIPHFDVGRDLVQIVDGQGQVMHSFDLDHADYPELRLQLLERHNIAINARPEAQALAATRIIKTEKLEGRVLFSASEFFSDPDVLASDALKSSLFEHDKLVFAGHDETRFWLKLREDGQLEITDLAQVPHGLHKIYVSVSDGVGLLQGAVITLSVNPQIWIGEHAFDPNSAMTLSLRVESDAAVGLWGQLVDDAGRPVGLPEYWGTSLGQASGLPLGFQAGLVKSSLAKDHAHGTMHFFADMYDRQETLALSVKANGEGVFELWHGDQVLADLAMHSAGAAALIDHIFVAGRQDSLLVVPLPASLDTVTFDAPGLAHQVSLQTRVVQESSRQGDFGFLLMDLQSGDVLDPQSGVQLENFIFTPQAVVEHAVYVVRSVPGELVESSNHFFLDAELNLNNLALRPFYVFDTAQGSELLFGGLDGMRQGISPVVRVDQNSFGVEDFVDGDYDFDDVVVTIVGLNVAAFEIERIDVCAVF